MKYFLTMFLILCCITSKKGFAQSQSCNDFNNKVVMNGSSTFFVTQCILHPILDPQIYNRILTMTNIAPVQISDSEYANFPIGKPYTGKDFAQEFNILEECADYNQHIVSSDNISFYYIENCKKRNFISFSDVLIFRNTNNVGATIAISDSDLSQIERGRLITVQKEKWAPDKTALQILQTLPSAAMICKKIQTNAATPFMAYYESVFYLQNCVLHPVPNFTIEIMEQVNDAGGMYELSTQDILALPQGKPWNNKN